MEDLLEALLLVQALGEAEPGAGDAGQRFAPAQEVAGEVGRHRLEVVVLLGMARPYRDHAHSPMACSRARSTSRWCAGSDSLAPAAVRT